MSYSKRTTHLLFFSAWLVNFNPNIISIPIQPISKFLSEVHKMEKNKKINTFDKNGCVVHVASVEEIESGEEMYTIYMIYVVLLHTENQRESIYYILFCTLNRSYHVF